jgi:transcriptional regulator with XRE-family HTH domain
MNRSSSSQRGSVGRLEQSRRDLGHRLRSQRLLRGATVTQIAEQSGMSTSKLSRIELGRIPQSMVDVEKLSQALQFPPEAAREILDIARRLAIGDLSETSRREVFDLVGGQTHVRENLTDVMFYQACFQGVVPGMLQTRDMMSIMYDNFVARIPPPRYLDSEKDVFVVERLRRQANLYDSRRRFQFLMTEATIRQPRGEDRLLIRQLQHILEISNLPNVTIRLFPVDRFMPVTIASDFTILDGLEVDAETMVHSYKLKDPVAVKPYVSAFEVLWEAALDEEESSRFIEGFAREVERRMDVIDLTAAAGDAERV